MNSNVKVLDKRHRQLHRSWDGLQDIHTSGCLCWRTDLMDSSHMSVVIHQSIRVLHSFCWRATHTSWFLYRTLFQQHSSRIAWWKSRSAIHLDIRGTFRWLLRVFPLDTVHTLLCLRCRRVHQRISRTTWSLRSSTSEVHRRGTQHHYCRICRWDIRMPWMHRWSWHKRDT